MELTLLVINVILTGLLALSLFGLLMLGLKVGKPYDKGGAEDGNKLSN